MVDRAYYDSLCFRLQKYVSLKVLGIEVGVIMHSLGSFSLNVLHETLVPTLQKPTDWR